MSIRRYLAVGVCVAALGAGMELYAQTPAGGATAAPRQGGAAPARTATAAAARTQVHGNLNQVMRAILFPSSNVIFAAQDAEEFAKIQPAKDPSLSPNPLTSTYGGWAAVENASLALAESANLLMVPGRRCSNGKPVPITNADWPKFVQGLRDAGMAAYKAAQAKDADKIVDVADTVTTACANCHNVYREKTEKQGGDASRCTK